MEKCGDFLTVEINPGAEKGCLFQAHMDTVHEKGVFGEPAVQIHDDRITGPGEHRQNHKREFSFDLSWFTTRDAIQQRGKINLSELAPGNYHCTHTLRDAHGENHIMRDFDFTVS